MLGGELATADSKDSTLYGRSEAGTEEGSVDGWEHLVPLSGHACDRAAPLCMHARPLELVYCWGPQI